MVLDTLPIFLFAAVALIMSVSMLGVGWFVGPRRQSAVKQMPYESGVDPIHDTHRRFDIRFHLVAIAFLLFDVELLFLYPWAVASKHPEGIARLQETNTIGSHGLLFGGLLAFVVLIAVGLVYEWRKGVLRWR